MARYALTDIHGCVRTFKALVQDQLQLKKEDELYILGDFVNKGPDSKGVIDFVMHLQSLHFQVFCLRGNHDQMLLNGYKKGKSAVSLTADEQEITLQSFGIKDFEHLPSKYVNFLKDLPHYLELPDYFLVHGGFDFKQPDIFKDTDAMMNIRNYKIDWQKIGFKKILHGHTPSALHAIKKTVSHRYDQINLDAGCTYYKNAAYGNLIALDMDSYELFIQSNTDRPYNVRRKS